MTNKQKAIKILEGMLNTIIIPVDVSLPSLGFDSLDEIECIITLENEFGVFIPDEKIAEGITIDQILEYIKD